MRHQLKNICIALTASLFMAENAFAAAATDRPENTGTTEMPQGLWEAFSKARLMIEPVKDPAIGARFAGQNPANRLHFLFDEKGVTFKREAGQTLVMQFESYGTAGAEQAYATQKLYLDSNTVTLDRGDIQEWYINRNEGLEQGFTLAGAPQGYAPGQEITLTLKLSGNLEPRWQHKGEKIAFYTKQSDYAFSYDKLLVMDAKGKNLPAKMLLAQGQLQLQFDPAGAQWPVTVDPVVSVETKLVGADADAGDNFGTSVALFGDTALIGSPNDDDTAANSGSAYVFTRSGSGWSQQAKFTASDANAGDSFGGSVALSGDTALIGALGVDCTATIVYCGAAYVFTRSGNAWTQQQKLMASDASTQAFFGISVALSADTALIGAYGVTCTAGTNCGAAYVFTRSGSTWLLQQKLTAESFAAANSQFGRSVALSGDRALIGAPGDLTVTGDAFTYLRAYGAWSQEQKLIAPDTATGDYFGSAVALSGSTAVIGVEKHSDFLSTSGSAYVFNYTLGRWSYQQELIASDAISGGSFGYSVALSGDTVLIGARGSNAAYVFVHTDSGWSQQRKLTASDAAAGDFFGYSVALSADTALIGVKNAQCTAGYYCGAAYLYHFPCSYGSSVLASRWTMIGIPCDPGAANTVQDILGDNLNPLNYITRWVVYKRDPVTDAYSMLSLGSPMALGEGYWIFSLDATVWDANGTTTPRNTSNPNCVAVKGCYEISLTPPGAGQPRRFNLIGQVFSFDVDWADVRVEVDGTAYTPSSAKAAGYMEKEMWIYNGNSYNVWDDVTPGMQGTLEPQDGIWVAVLNGAAGKTIKLLIPASNTNSAPPPPP